MAGASSSGARRFLSSLKRLAVQTVPPVTMVACGSYVAFEAHRVLSGSPNGSDSAMLRRQMEKDAEELDERRLMWIQNGSARKLLYSAEVIQTVHNIQALGPAGVILMKNEVVEVLEEGQGMNQGFSVVRRGNGEVGIFPKQYLRLQAVKGETPE
mmetsp:Transcript_6844/g.12123  ORF Transcript_6844/g.12123 Transcript_6844/m.12123 type:complete len:155 (-) Transcript_6844:57-521(-)